MSICKMSRKRMLLAFDAISLGKEQHLLSSQLVERNFSSHSSWTKWKWPPSSRSSAKVGWIENGHLPSFRSNILNNSSDVYMYYTIRVPTLATFSSFSRLFFSPSNSYNRHDTRYDRVYTHNGDLYNGVTHSLSHSNMWRVKGTTYVRSDGRSDVLYSSLRTTRWSCCLVGKIEK